MQIQSTKATTADTSSTSNVQDMSNMFMTLLVTQLKTQDPTSPMDPEQFVGQLVQFNSLNELIKIREVLQGVSTGASLPTDNSGGV